MYLRGRILGVCQRSVHYCFPFDSYLQLIFGSEAEAIEAAQMLENFRDGVTVKHCAQPSNKREQHLMDMSSSCFASFWLIVA